MKSTNGRRHVRLRCPHCNHPVSYVTCSQGTEGDEEVRRRRECAGCEKTYWTSEVVARKGN